MRLEVSNYSVDIPGAITSISFGVNKLFFIRESYLRMEISQRTFLAEYEFLKTSVICLTA